MDWLHGGDLYGEAALAEEAARRPRQSLLPGLAVCAVASAAAAWLSEHYGAPIILMGLLLGLSLSFVGGDERTHAGLDFATKTCLRWGIVLLGTQITLAQIGALGAAPFGALLVVMAAAMGAALLVARLAGQSLFMGLLAGGATAICGASAALALYAVIGRERLSQGQFALTLVGIMLASALAMSFYPLLASTTGMSDRQAGFLIGASIHDVAQAIGGGYAFSDTAGGYAAIVKLTRVALLAPVVLLVSMAVSQGGERVPRVRWRVLRLAFSWFMLGFLAMAALNSAVDLPAPLTAWALVVSKALLLLAVTATAMRSRSDLIMQMGWQAALPVAAATIASLLAAFAAVLLLM